MLITQVISRLEVEGIHRWKTCPIEEVYYLREYHRHLFKIECRKTVQHNDRDVEFIELSHRIKSYLNQKYYDEKQKCLLFGDKSCETISTDLVTVFDLDSCETNEDGEGGAVVTNNNRGVSNG